MEQPIIKQPIRKDEIAALAKADINQDFKENEIDLIPSGFSSVVNGGAVVEVGGDGYNALSVRLSLVFDAGGKLLYYEKGSDLTASKK